MFDLAALEEAEGLVRRDLPPTPTYAWPLLAERAGCDVFVKHENHTPVGAFKVRGGLVYVDALRRERPGARGIVSATRGNHGQSLAFAGRRRGLAVAIVVPRGNSAEKNAAMRALGAEVIEAGRDFDEARPAAARLADERGFVLVPSFHPTLVRGVATYALELFRQAPDLDTVYVPIGLGSGICGVVRTRDLLGLRTRVVGVVTAAADAYARSFEAGRVVTTDTAHTFADGMACRVPDPLALEAMRQGVERVVRVHDAAIAEAIRAYHQDTHNLAEGAGAASLAALLQEREPMRGKRVAIVLTGGNIDRDVYARVLRGEAPAAAELGPGRPDRRAEARGVHARQRNGVSPLRGPELGQPNLIGSRRAGETPAARGPLL
ncbi:MAG TPA: threonine dehydratase [Polyangiaceae bacterium]|nr:threonine dehydratase [Polyangiaceae bacterium]